MHRGPARGLIVSIVICMALLGAASYEAALATGAITLRAQPGQEPTGESIVLIIGLLGLGAGAAACWVAASRPQTRRERIASLMIVPLGAAFMTARFYTYDPYYLPTLRRMSDGGVIPAPVVYVLLALVAAAVVLTVFRRTAGLTLAGVLLVACALTALFAGTGH